MINHIIAIWSLASDIEVMDALRRIYRADWLEPGLVGFFVFQMVSGLILLGSRMTKKLTSSAFSRQPLACTSPRFSYRI
jgi:hypothetical protein